MKSLEETELGAGQDPEGENKNVQTLRTIRARGLGRVYQLKYRDRKTREWKVSAVWWVQYSFRGKVHRESSGSTNRSDAVKLLKRRLGELGRGRPVGPDVERTTFEDLATMLENDYRANGRRSADRIGRALAHLKETFSGERALDITTDRITAYVAARQEAKAANATVNRELSALKRMFRLGEQAGKVAQRPHIPMLQENNARKGFFGAEQFRTLHAHLPAYLKAPLATAYITGWRIKSELLTRQKHHVDLEAGWLRLEPGETKNGEGCMFPLTPELWEILEHRLAETRELEKATGQIIPWLFHRDGRPIKNYRRAWLTACKKAGVPGRIPHDFRRTAVRNLERAGVPRSAAMKMVGHKTESVYRRYAIADEGMLREGAAKLSALHQAERQAPRQVIPHSKGTRS